MFLALRAAVEDALREALAARGAPTDDLGIEEPPANVEAVLASSVAFRLAAEDDAAPPAVAAALADALDAAAIDYVAAVRAQGPYVNFSPNERYFAETLGAADDPEYGRRPDRETRVVVEHTSANPTGPIHVGRARNPIIGDALARVLDFAGYDVTTHYYVNDAGRQLATFAWAYDTFDEADLPSPERDKPDHDLVRYYRRGTTYLAEADPDAVEAAETEIQAIMQGLEAGDDATYERVHAVVDRVLEGMRQTLSRLPADFDEFVKETRFMRDGSTADVVERLQATDEAAIEDGAWQLDLSAFGIDQPLVFLRSDGTTLYQTRDLAHHEWTFDSYDRAITVIGEDHRLAFEQLAAALSVLGHETDCLEHVFYSWVNLPGGGGMSTREGTGIDLDDLLDEAVERARQEVESRLDDRVRDDDLDEAAIDRIARQVGIGAVRYDIVATQPTKGITFEWDRALDFDAQSAPYVQYVHARSCGILDEAAAAGHDVPDAAAVDASLLAAPAERDLLRTIARFPAVIEDAAADNRPHVVATYTRDIAEAFNAFYRECPVLDAEPDRRAARLALVAGARTTVGNALGVLGVAAPESM